MPSTSDTIQVYIEQGTRRAFACSIDWPGWCRIGRDEDAALKALVDYGQRYAQILHSAHIPFQAPAAASALVVGERLAGNSTTDFGAPDVTPTHDTQPLDDAALQRFQMLLQAYWQAFDAAFSMAAGKSLRLGPRGGGRDLDGVVRHVLDVDRSYLARLAWKQKRSETVDLPEQLRQTRQDVLSALERAARGDLPTRGPRGGVLWTPRYFVRRLGWHVLDHVWELEDRVM